MRLIFCAVPPAPAECQEQRGGIRIAVRLGLHLSQHGLLICLLGSEKLQVVGVARPLLLLHQIEGGTGSLSTQVGRFFALNLGSSIPPTGTNLLVTFVGNRWAFRYDK